MLRTNSNSSGNNVKPVTSQRPGIAKRSIDPFSDGWNSNCKNCASDSYTQREVQLDKMPCCRFVWALATQTNGIWSKEQQYLCKALPVLWSQVHLRLHNDLVCTQTLLRYWHFSKCDLHPSFTVKHNSEIRYLILMYNMTWEGNI